MLRSFRELFLEHLIFFWFSETLKRRRVLKFVTILRNFKREYFGLFFNGWCRFQEDFLSSVTQFGVKKLLALRRCQFYENLDPRESYIWGSVGLDGCCNESNLGLKVGQLFIGRFQIGRRARTLIESRILISKTTGIS